MLLDLNNPEQRKKADKYFKHLVEKGARIELTEKKTKRTLPQNSYLHAIISLFAIEYGYTRQEVKQTIFKKHVNPETFEYDFVDKITGEIEKEYKSSADIDTAEMTTAIQRFRNYSSQNGLYLLSSDEYIEQRFYIDQEIERLKEFL